MDGRGDAVGRPWMWGDPPGRHSDPHVGQSNKGVPMWGAVKGSVCVCGGWGGGGPYGVPTGSLWGFGFLWGPYGISVRFGVSLWGVSEVWGSYWVSLWGLYGVSMRFGVHMGSL